MSSSPQTTASLIATLTLPAIILGILFQRRTWCRYLCPLGKLVGVFASASMLELRANYSICNNDCLTHSCYTGDKECQDGCPMFEGPFSLRSNLDCTLCGNCIKNCPNQSPQINLRLPGYELWSSQRSEKSLIFLVPMIMGTQFFRGLEKAGYFHPFLDRAPNKSYMLLFLLVTITVLVFAALKTTERLMSQAMPHNKKFSAGILSYGLLLITLAFEIAFQTERLLLFGGQMFPVLGRQLGFHWEAFGANAAPWAIKTLQAILVLLGSCGASLVLRRLYRNCVENGSGKSPFSWRLPVILTTIGYLWLFFAG